MLLRAHRKLLSRSACKAVKLNPSHRLLTGTAIHQELPYAHRHEQTANADEADSRAVLGHVFKSKRIDSAVVKRVRARAETVRKEMPKEEETDFTLDLLRESRDE